MYVFLTLLIGSVPGQLGHFDVSRVTMKLGVSVWGAKEHLNDELVEIRNPKVGILEQGESDK